MNDQKWLIQRKNSWMWTNREPWVNESMNNETTDQQKNKSFFDLISPTSLSRMSSNWMMEEQEWDGITPIWPCFFLVAFEYCSVMSGSDEQIRDSILCGRDERANESRVAAITYVCVWYEMSYVCVQIQMLWGWARTMNVLEKVLLNR